jgi:hypothetical protein
MKINLDRNFTKFVGSKMKAIRLVNKIAAKDNDRADSCMIRRSGRYLISVSGTQKTFNWRYDGDTKTLSVGYVDGRPLPEEVKPKNTYFIIWVEGLSPERGEKVKYFSADGIKYTLKMTDALRVRTEHIDRIKGMLRNSGVANWVIDNPNSYVKTHYAPKGTLFEFNFA